VKQRKRSWILIALKKVTSKRNNDLIGCTLRIYSLDLLDLRVPSDRNQFSKDTIVLPD
jgi:hypothetical protein